MEFKNFKGTHQACDDLYDDPAYEDAFFIETKEGERLKVTVVNLFLLSEKNKLLKTKILAAFITILSALTIAFMDIPFWAMVVGVALFILAEAKDQIVSYRVTRGYFGTNTSEALQLIKFIREKRSSTCPTKKLKN